MTLITKIIINNKIKIIRKRNNNKNKNKNYFNNNNLHKKKLAICQRCLNKNN